MTIKKAAQMGGFFDSGKLLACLMTKKMHTAPCAEMRVFEII